jgi:hypothetical protein
MRVGKIRRYRCLLGRGLAGLYSLKILTVSFQDTPSNVDSEISWSADPQRDFGKSRSEINSTLQALDNDLLCVRGPLHQIESPGTD